jgi:hypothetical protein
MRIIVAVVLLIATHGVYAKCAPKYVLRIVVAAAEGDADTPAFALRPKTLYRSGERLGRVEEEKNPDTGLHLLVVFNEPDAWIVNRSDMTGQHSVDPGPSFLFRAPIVPILTSEYWKNFELGCEVPFMKAAGSEAVPVDGGGRMFVHRAEGITARLFVDTKEIPTRVEVTGPDLDLAIVYHAFEELRDAPPDLFTKPAGVKFVEPQQ